MGTTYMALDTHQVDRYAGQHYRDVLFHTPACWSNALLFANDCVPTTPGPGALAVPPAAMYIVGNAVGVQCKPAPGVAMDVAGTLVARSGLVLPPLTSSCDTCNCDGLVVTSSQLAYTGGGAPVVTLDRCGVVRTSSVVMAGGGAYDARACVTILGACLVGVDMYSGAVDYSSVDGGGGVVFVMRISSAGSVGEAVEGQLTAGTRFLVGTRLHTVLAQAVVAHEVLLTVGAHHWPDTTGGVIAAIDVLLPRSHLSLDPQVTIGPLRNVTVVGQGPDALVAEFDDTSTHAICAEFQALAALVAASAPESPLCPLVWWIGAATTLVQLRAAAWSVTGRTAVCVTGAGGGPLSGPSSLLPPSVGPCLVRVMLRAPLPPLPPLTDRFCAATYMQISGTTPLLVLVGATNLLAALGGDASDIVVNSVTRGLQALWCVSAGGATSDVVRVTSTMLVGQGVLHVTVEQDPRNGRATLALAATLGATSTLYSQLIGQPVRVIGSQPLDDRHLQVGLYPGHPTGDDARQLLAVAADTPGCTLLMHDPWAAPGGQEAVWAVTSTPDSAGSFFLRAWAGECPGGSLPGGSLPGGSLPGGSLPGGSLPTVVPPPWNVLLGPRTVFLQTLMPMRPSSFPGTTCVGTGVPREALTVLGRAAVMDGIVIYSASQPSLITSTTLSVDGGGGLVVDGNASVLGRMVARSYRTVSDARLKRDIGRVDACSALADIMRVNVCTYRFKESATPEGDEAMTVKMGVLAQELEGVLPSAVSETIEGTKVVDTHELLFRAIAAIQELARGRSG